ncbi:hypothetical protein D9M68_862480 [compost metagenome]
MLRLAQAEIGLQLVVERQRADVLAAAEHAARHLLEVERVVRHLGVQCHEALQLRARVVELLVRVARVLPHGEGVVDAVLELVADHLLVLVEAVEAGLADEQF